MIHDVKLFHYWYNVDLDHLVNLVSVGFLYLTITMFSLVVNKYLRGNALRLKILFLIKLYCLLYVLAYIRGSQFYTNRYYGIYLMVIFHSCLSFDIY